MTNGNNDVRELEDLLTELEGQGALPVGQYSEEDDAVTQLMDAPVGEQEWMVQVTPLDRRMMSTDQILAELATGNLITPQVLVWRAGMSDWAPISSVDELRVGRAVMDTVPERRPLPAPLPPPPAPVPPRINANALGSSTLASPNPIARAPLPPPPSVPFVPPPALDLAPPPAPLPVFGAMSSAPSAPELSPFSPPVSVVPAPGSIPAPAPAVARVNTHGPVAVDFSEMEPPRSAPTRTLVGSGIAAVLMIAGTVYALSAGGVFEASPRVSSEVAASKPAPVAAAAPAVEATPAPKPAEPPPPAEPAPSAAAASEPQTQPASVKEVSAEGAAAAKSASDEGEKAASDEKAEHEEASSATPTSSKARRLAARRNRRASTEERASKARAKPEAREPAERKSKPSAAAAAPEVARAEESVEAPKSGDQPGSTFNKQAATTALDDAATKARNCRPAGGPSGPGRLQVRYEPNGKVGAVTLLTPSFENTTTGDCVVMVFRRASVPAFTGTPSVVMNKNFEIP